MEVLELDGKRYVKAVSIARDLGYTADYVGQLCRGGKIDAHLVGRSWYVDEESIRSHKSTRYRSSKSKTKEGLKLSIVHEQEETPKQEEKQHNKSRFYSKLQPQEVKYEEDDSELVPILTEKESQVSGRIEVHLADAEKLEVSKKSESYELTATELPKVKFKGKLAVSDAPEIEEDLSKKTRIESALKSVEHAEPTKKRKVVETEQPNKHGPKAKKLHPKEVETLKSTKLAVNKDTSAEGSIKLQRDGVVSMTCGQRAEGDTGTIAVTALKGSQSRPSGRATFLYISASLTTAVVLALGVLSLEESVQTDNAGNITARTYSINLSNVVSTVKAFK